MDEPRFPCCNHCYPDSVSNGCFDKDQHTIPCNEMNFETLQVCQTEKDQINV